MDRMQAVSKHAWVMARVFFAGSFAIYAIDTIEYGRFNFWVALFIGVVVGSAAYCFVYVSLPFIQVAFDTQSPPDKANEVTQPMPPNINMPEPEQPVHNDNGRFLQFAHRYIEIPGTVSRKHLDIVREARRRGDLPSVNTNRLNGIGISRFSSAPNAITLMDFLKRVGAVDEAGQWTAEGDKMFAPPAPINGRMQSAVV